MPRPATDATAPDDPAWTTRGGSVDVLGDVVDLYLRTPNHERGEIRAFADLVDGLLDGAGPEERRRVALALAPRADTPPSLARRLAMEPIEIAEAMIVRSPVLTSRDLVDIMRCGPAHVRCVGRRLDLAPDIAAVLVEDARPAPATAPIRAGNRRRSDRPAAVAATTAKEDSPPSPIDEAATAAPTTIETPDPGETTEAEPMRDQTPPPFFRVPLRGSTPAPATTEATPSTDEPEAATIANPLPGGWAFLVLDSGARWRALQAAALDVAVRGPATSGRTMDADLVGDRLFAAAVAGDRPFFTTALAEALDLPPSLIDAVLEEASGEVLAILLVACGLDEIRATSVLLHHLGEHATVGALQDLAALTGRTARRTAERLVSTWREEASTRHGEVRRLTDPAERLEAPSAREVWSGDSRPARRAATSA